MFEVFELICIYFLKIRIFVLFKNKLFLKFKKNFTRFISSSVKSIYSFNFSGGVFHCHYWGKYSAEVQNQL